MSCHGPVVRLICFPYAGGGSSLYFRWQRLAGDLIDVIPIQLPGRESRSNEPALDDWEQVMQEVQPALSATVELPAVYFGHSLGGLMAYAAALRRRRLAVSLPIGLITSSCCAPQLLPRSEVWHTLDDDRFFHSLLTRYDLCETDAAGEAELIRLLLPTLRADFKLFETYRHAAERALSIPIQAVGGTDDSYATRRELEAWREQTTASFRCRTFPGGHFYFRSQERQVVDFLVATCRRFLNADDA